MEWTDELSRGLERRVELGGIRQCLTINGDQCVQIRATLVVSSYPVEVSLRDFTCIRLARKICSMELGDGGFFDGKRGCLQCE